MERETLAALGIGLWALGGAERARSDALVRSLATEQRQELEGLRLETERLAVVLERLECERNYHLAQKHNDLGWPRALCPTCRVLADHNECCTDSRLVYFLAESAARSRLDALAVLHAGRALELLAEESSAGPVPRGTPTVASILRLRSTSLRALHEGVAADLDLELAAKLEPESPETLVALADVAEAEGRWAESLGLLDAAIAIGLSREHALWFESRANMLRRRRTSAANRAGRFEEARRWALEELAARPGLTWAEIALETANVGLAEGKA